MGKELMPLFIQSEYLNLCKKLKIENKRHDEETARIISDIYYLQNEMCSHEKTHVKFNYEDMITTCDICGKEF